jgi:biotin carboxylase
MSLPKPITIVCLSSYFKGNRFIETCKKEGCTVILLTVESKLNEPWCRELIDEVFALPDFKDHQAVIHSLSYLARTREIDRLAPLDDYDVELVARLREHLRVPGMGETTARYFRDKLAMRARAEFTGLPIPRFVHILNHDRIGRFLREVPAPWMFKPRGEASSLGITKCTHPDEVWARVEQLGDRQSSYLLEEMIAGDVYHVDSIVSEGTVLFAEAHRYCRPLFEVTHEGGIFATMTIPRDDAATRELLALNQELVTKLGFVRGVLHTEYIRGAADGKFYFLETAARVGGAHIVELVEGSTGVNLWAEWARIEIAQGEWPYDGPRPTHRQYGGLIVSLARQEVPDTSAYTDAEICWRLDKKNHAGFVLRSPSYARIAGLMESYMGRIQQDFFATLPAPAKPPS